MGILERIYERTATAGAEPIACTLTPVLGYDQITPRILELNGQIIDYCKRHGIPLVELFASTSDGHNRLREDYSDDGVHLNSSGYRMVAKAIGEVILKLLSDKI